MQRSIWGGFAAVVIALSAGSAWAGSVDPSQGTPKQDTPKQGDTKQGDKQDCTAQQQEAGLPANVIVIRTLAGHDATQMRDGAALIPMNVDGAKKGADGKVDQSKIVQQTKDQLDKCKSVDVRANQGQNAPSAVQQQFDSAQQGSEEEVLAWRYWYPYGYGGYYGYGYYPYYGFYSSYYPYYGYYYGGYTYPYYYSGYYPYGGYNYYYYYRY